LADWSLEHSTHLAGEPRGLEQTDDEWEAPQRTHRAEYPQYVLVWAYYWQFIHCGIVLRLWGSSTLIFVNNNEVNWKIFNDFSVFSESTKNKGNGCLVVLWRTLVTCLTLNDRSVNSFITVSVTVDGWIPNHHTDRFVLCWLMSMKLSIVVLRQRTSSDLYVSGEAVCIFNWSVEGLQTNWSLPMRLLNSSQRLLNSSTPLIKIGGGGLLVSSEAVEFEAVKNFVHVVLWYDFKTI